MRPSASWAAGQLGPHARPGRLRRSAIACIVLDPAPRLAGGAGRSPTIVAAPTTIRTRSTRSPPSVDVDHLRVRERAGRGGRAAGRAACRCGPAPTPLRGRPGPARREDALPRRSASPPRRSRPSSRAPTRRGDRAIGLPGVLKTRRSATTARARSCSATPARPTAPGRRSAACRCILEALRAVRRASCRSWRARGRDGEIAFYPLVENHHADGILRRHARAGAGADGRAAGAGRGASRARSWSGSTTSACWRSSCSTGRRTLLANEMAPRVHNSGHWTIEGAETSQFENHLRAILAAAGPDDAVGQLGRW